MGFSTNSDIPIPPHPFYPPELNLAAYIANDWDIPTLLFYFFGSWAVILSLTYLIVIRANPKIKWIDLCLIMWFVLTGTIHFFFEGYFSINHTRMASQQDFFGQLWKEYARSDSRYMTSDPFVLCMETVTAALWGPMSYLTVYLITVDSPYRYPVQAFVSVGQFYGDLLYYMTNTFDHMYRGVSYSRPEFVYFWIYYVFLNGFWIVIPLYCIYNSASATARAFRTVGKVGKTLAARKDLNGSTVKQANGHAKKTL